MTEEEQRQPASGEEADSAREGATGEDDLARLRDELSKATERADDLAGRWQRTQADFINYKRRMDQEREQLAKFANMTLIARILPVLDDLERAMSTLPRELQGLTWLEGVALIRRKIEYLLEQEGLSKIEVLGEDFDPKVHEAVIVEEGVNLLEGKVVAELQAGYKLHDRVLRSALVKVGRDTTETSKE